MKKSPQLETGISRFESRLSTAIMLAIVLISMSIFATIAWQVTKLLLRLPIF